jgi:hypothetical protein
VETAALGAFSYAKMLKDGLKVGCRVQVFALEVTDLAKSFKERGVRTLEWVSCDEAVRRVNEPELRDLILVFQQRMANRAPLSNTKQIAPE